MEGVIMKTFVEENKTIEILENGLIHIIDCSNNVRDYLITDYAGTPINILVYMYKNNMIGG